MNLHNSKMEFEALSQIVSEWRGIPAEAVRRDYYITLLLGKLSASEYSDSCVFKGGTSLSKCYPGTIERFSEDIDLTYLPQPGQSDKAVARALKSIEKVISDGFRMEKIADERNDRNKSAYVHFGEYSEKIKLEIGSNIRPEPYCSKEIKSFIQEYLEYRENHSAIRQYELGTVKLNVLAVERTFLDKVMSVKRHAYNGTLINKVRHIYDVTKLFEQKEIQDFVSDEERLKQIVQTTKQTDSFYFEKRKLIEDYNPLERYGFDVWRDVFCNRAIKSRYERLHEDLLFTNDRQKFEDAIRTFEEINRILENIEE